MSLFCRCPRDHVGEALPNACCPICGRSGVRRASPAVGLDSCYSVQLPADVLLAPSQVNPCPATDVRPALANEQGQGRPRPPQEPDDIEFIARPAAVLSSAAPPAGFTRPNVLIPLAPAKGEYPAIPGYEILGELGRGGMGVVYKARQAALDRIVALKMILGGKQAGERARSRFRAEAQAVARLQHPNIVQIFEVGEHEGNSWFSLEFVAGGSLADRCAGEKLPVNEAARLIETLAGAVHFAHERGIVHRDLKPANVLLVGQPAAVSFDAQGQAGSLSYVPKITDFGLAKKLDDDVKNTKTGLVVGTPHYMAPEQAVGRSAGPAADVYSLGVMLYQLATGRLPFTGETAMDILFKVARQEPPAPSGVAPGLPRDLETIILKCLEKEPKRRYAGAAHLAEDLRRFAAHEPILARPLHPLERGWRWVRRRRAAVALAVAVGVALVSLLVAFGIHVQGDRRRQAEAVEVLHLAREARDKGDWKEVLDVLAELRRQVHGDRLLSGYSEEVDALVGQAEGYLAAKDTLRRFRASRDDAFFHALLAGEPGARGLEETIRRKALDALKLVGASAAGGPELGPFFAESEKEEIRLGCYELLLDLADTTACEGRPAPEGARQALAILDTAARLASPTRVSHLRRARCLEQLGQVEAARQEQARAKAHRAATWIDHYLAGCEHYRQERLVEAESSFAAAGRLRPGHFWTRYGQARCYVRLKKWEAARDALTLHIDHPEQMVWVHLLRGFVEGQMGKYPEAETDFAAALKLLNGRTDRGALYVLYNNRAVTRLAEKKFPEAEQDLKSAIELQPNQYQAYLTLAHVYQYRKAQTPLPHHGRLRRQAFQSLSMALDVARRQRLEQKIDPGILLLLHRQRYRLHLEGDDVAAALAELQAVIDLDGLAAQALAHAHRDRGRLFHSSGQTKSALREYDAALASAPGEAETWLCRAETLLSLKRYGEAVKDFDRYLKEGGKPLARAFHGRALAYLQQGEHQSALGDFSLALGLAPNDLALRLQRGKTYLACQAWKLADRDFDEVLRHDDAVVAAYDGRATARLHSGQIREAIEDAEQIAQRADNDSTLIYRAACLLAQAAGQIEPGRRDGPAARQRAEYQDRALIRLRQAVELLPAGERQVFWRDKVQAEPALRSLSARQGFRQLDKRYR
jgi:tetratricopeptide (TPR) repeat protein/tRNA A-37 threonylcarbamoyl transferase component Bud32